MVSQVISFLMEVFGLSFNLYSQSNSQNSGGKYFFFHRNKDIYWVDANIS